MDEAIADLRKALSKWKRASDPSQHGVPDAMYVLSKLGNEDARLALSAARLILDAYWSFEGEIIRIARLAGTVAGNTALDAVNDKPVPSLFNE